MDKLARSNRAKYIKNGRHTRQKIRKLVGLCGYQDNSDFASLKVLLVLHSLIKGQKYLKARLHRQKQQLTILLPLPNPLQERCGIHVQEDDS